MLIDQPASSLMRMISPLLERIQKQLITTIFHQFKGLQLSLLLVKTIMAIITLENTENEAMSEKNYNPNTASTRFNSQNDKNFDVEDYKSTSKSDKGTFSEARTQRTENDKQRFEPSLEGKKRVSTDRLAFSKSRQPTPNQRSQPIGQAPAEQAVLVLKSELEKQISEKKILEQQCADQQSEIQNHLAEYSKVQLEKELIEQQLKLIEASHSKLYSENSLLKQDVQSSQSTIEKYKRQQKKLQEQLADFKTLKGGSRTDLITEALISNLKADKPTLKEENQQSTGEIQSVLYDKLKAQQAETYQLQQSLEQLKYQINNQKQQIGDDQTLINRLIKEKDDLNCNCSNFIKELEKFRSNNFAEMNKAQAAIKELQTKNQALVSEIKNKSETLLQSQTEKDKLSNNNIILQERLNQLAQESLSLNDENSVLLTKLQMLENQNFGSYAENLKLLQQQKEEIVEKCKVLSQQIKINKQSYEDEINSLKSQSSSRQSQIQFEMQLNQVTSEKMILKQDISVLQEKLKSQSKIAQENYNKLLTKYSSLESLQRQAEQNLSEQKESQKLREEQLLQQISQLNYEIDELIQQRNEKENLQNNIDLKTSEVQEQSNSEQIEILLQEKNNLEFEFNFLQQSHEQVSSEISQKTAQIKDLQAKIKKLKQQKQEISQIKKICQEENKTLLDQVEYLNSLINQIKLNEEEKFSYHKKQSEEELSGLKEQIFDLERKNQQLTQEQDTQITENLQNRCVIEQLESKAQEMLADKQSLKSEKAQLEQEINSNYKELVRIQNEVQLQKIDFDQLSAYKNEIEKQLQSDRSEIQNLQSQIFQLNAENQKSLDQVNLLEVEIQKRDDQNEQLLKIIAQLKQEKEEGEYSQAKKILEMQSLYDQLQQQNCNTINESKNHQHELTISISMQEEQQLTFKKEIQMLKKGNDDLYEQIASLNEEFNSQCKELELVVQNMQQENCQLNSSKEQFSQEIQKQSLQFQQLESENNQNIQRIVQYESQNSELKWKYHDLLLKESDLSEQFKLVTQGLQDANSAFIELKQQSYEKEVLQKQEFSCQINNLELELQNQIDLKKQYIDSKIKEINSLKDKLKQLQALENENQSLKSQLEMKARELSNYMEQLKINDAIKMEKDNLSIKQQQLQQQLDQRSKDIQSLEEKLTKQEQIDSENKKLKNQIEQIQQQIANKQKSINEISLTNKQLQTQFLEQVQQIEQMREEKVKCTEEMELLQDQIKMLKEQNEQLILQQATYQSVVKNQLSEHFKNSDQLKHQVDYLNIQKDNLTKELVNISQQLQQQLSNHSELLKVQASQNDEIERCNNLIEQQKLQIAYISQENESIQQQNLQLEKNFKEQLEQQADQFNRKIDKQLSQIELLQKEAQQNIIVIQEKGKKEEEKLKARIFQVQETKIQLQEQLSLEKTEKGKLQMQLDNLNESNTHLKSENDACKFQLQSLGIRLSELQSHHEGSLQRQENIQQQYSGLLVNFLSVSEENVKMKAQIDELSEQVQQLIFENKEYCQSQECLFEQIQKSKQSNDSFSQHQLGQIRVLEEQIKQLRKEKNELQLQIPRVQSNCRQLESQVNKCLNEKCELEKQKEQLSVQLKSSTESQYIEKHQFEQSIMELKEANEQVIQQYQNDNQKLKLQVEQLSRQIGSLIKENELKQSNLRNEIVECQESLQEKLVRMEQSYLLRLERLNSEYSLKENDICQLNREIEDIQQQNERQQRAIESYKNEIADLSSQLIMIKSEVERKELMNQQLQRDKQSQLESIEQMEIAFQGKIDLLNSTIKQTNQEMTSLNEQLCQKSFECEDVQNSLDSLLQKSEMESSLLKVQIQNLKTQLEFSKTQLQLYFQVEKNQKPKESDAKLMNEIGSKNAKLALYENQINSIKQENLSLIENHNGLKNCLSQQEAKIADINLQFKDKCTELETSKKLSDDHLQQQELLVQELNKKWQDSMEQLSKLKDCHDKDMKDQEEQFSSMRALLFYSNEKQAFQQEQINALKTSLLELQSQDQQKSGQLDELKLKLKCELEKKAQYEKRIIELEDENNSIKTNNINKQKVESESLDKNLKSKHLELERVISEKDQLSIKINKLESDHQKQILLLKRENACSVESITKLMKQIEQNGIEKQQAEEAMKFSNQMVLQQIKQQNENRIKDIINKSQQESQIALDEQKNQYDSLISILEQKNTVSQEVVLKQSMELERQCRQIEEESKKATVLLNRKEEELRVKDLDRIYEINKLKSEQLLQRQEYENQVEVKLQQYQEKILLLERQLVGHAQQEVNQDFLAEKQKYENLIQQKQIVINSLQIEKYSLEDEVVRLREDLQSYQIQSKEVKRQFEILQSQNDQFQKEFQDKIDQQLKAHKKQLSIQEIQINQDWQIRMDEKMEEVYNQIQDQENAKVLSKNLQLISENNQIKQSMLQLNNEKNQATQKLEEQEQEFNNLREQTHLQKQEIQLKKEEIQKYQQKLEQMKTISQLNENQNKQQDQIDQTAPETQKSDLLNQIEALQNQLLTAREELEQLKACQNKNSFCLSNEDSRDEDIQVLIDELQAEKRENDEKQRVLQEQIKKYDIMVKTNEQLKQKLDELRKRNRQLEQKFDESVQCSVRRCVDEEQNRMLCEIRREIGELDGKHDELVQISFSNQQLKKKICQQQIAIDEIEAENYDIVDALKKKEQQLQSYVKENKILVQQIQQLKQSLLVKR